MGENTVTIQMLRGSLGRLVASGKDRSCELIDAAIENLNELRSSLDEIVVSGRESIDTLFGIMLGLDLIIGKAPDNGEKDVNEDG